MPIATPGNDYLIAIDKQTDEATVSSTADYSLPTYDGANLGPVYDEQRVEVTDASSVQGDIEKGPTSWSADFQAPAYGSVLGRFLQALWPTDTKQDDTPTSGLYTHTFSGLGATQPWIALYSEWPSAGAFEQTFGKGVATGITFSASPDETPLRVGFRALGQQVTVANYSATVAEDNTDGYFTLRHASASIEADFDTPNSNPSSAITNVINATVDVNRPATPIKTADGVSIAYIGAGKVVPSGTLTMAYSSWDAYRATYFGAVNGTAASTTVVKGALALNFRHTVNATWTFEIYVPAVQFAVDVPTPNTSGDFLQHSVRLNIQKPSSGSHVVPILVNNVSTAY